MMHISLEKATLKMYTRSCAEASLPLNDFSHDLKAVKSAITSCNRFNFEQLPDKSIDIIYVIC